MKQLAFCIVALLFCIQSRGAEQSGLCDNLSRFTCAPGEYSDGTATVHNQSAFDKDEVKALQENVLQDAKNKFRQLLANPENQYFKKIALSTFGLSNSPDCTANSKEHQEICLDNLSKSLAETSIKNLFPQDLKTNTWGSPNYAALEGSASDMKLLINSPFYKKVFSDLESGAQQKLTDPKMVSHVQNDIFSKVKEILETKVAEYVKDDETREHLIDKIKAIQWDGTSCDSLFKKSKDSDQDTPALAPILVSNAVYEPLKNSFKVCGGKFLYNKSEFSFVHDIAHELSHSIDPCEIARGPSDFSFHYSRPTDQERSEKEFPIKGIVSCLRASIDAEHMPASAKGIVGDVGSVAGGKMGGMGNYGVMAGGPTGYKPPPFSFCTKEVNGMVTSQDQITEGFADWMADEILPAYFQQRDKDQVAKGKPSLTPEQYRNGYSNIFRGRCYPDGADFVHPTIAHRVDGLILSNPDIRKQMGCTKPYKAYEYCPGNSDESDENRQKKEEKREGSVK